MASNRFTEPLEGTQIPSRSTTGTIRIKTKRSMRVAGISQPVVPPSWPALSNKRFPSWVAETFDKYRLPKGKMPRSEGEGFTPFPYQEFIRDYLQERSPYRGILLYHGLGSGKTCTAITVAENLKRSKDIIVLLPASLIPNFIEEGLKFCGAEEYKTSRDFDPYIFVSYNASNTLKQLEAVGSLDGKVIIIEEVHNLISMVTNEDSKKGRAIYDLLMGARDCKIVALSGTPIVNDPFEIGALLNILRGPIEISTFSITRLLGEGKFNYKAMERALLDSGLVDFVSTNLKGRTVEMHTPVSSWRPDFPDVIKRAREVALERGADLEHLRIDQYTLFPPTKAGFDKVFLDTSDVHKDRLKNVEVLRRRMTGLISFYSPREADYPDFTIHPNVEVPMSAYQFAIYAPLARAEKRSVMGRKYRIYTRQLSNFAFPEDVQRPGFDEIAIKKDEEENREIKGEIAEAIRELQAGAQEYFSKEGLAKYSPKMLAILEHIERSPGLVFVYSDFRTLEGVGIFAMVLEAHGYSEFSPPKKGGVVAEGLRYALYTGGEDMRERKETISLFRSPSNAHGEYIKVILATRAGAEGLDLKNIRQIHLMEPYWNEVRADQVIGRGVRRQSHIDLPPEERHVDVYRYLAVFTPEQEREMRGKKKVPVESTDQQIYEIAQRKKAVTDEILGIMREVGVDCILNIKQNPEGVRCHSYGDDVEGKAYLPRLEHDLTYRPASVVKKRDLSLGALGRQGELYLVDAGRKALFPVDDVARAKPVKGRPKIKAKVWIDLDKGTVYEYETKGNLPPIGRIEDGKLVK